MFHGDWLPMVQARAFMQISFQWEGKNGHLAVSSIAVLGKRMEKTTFKAILSQKPTSFSCNHILAHQLKLRAMSLLVSGQAVHSA